MGRRGLKSTRRPRETSGPNNFSVPELRARPFAVLRRSSAGRTRRPRTDTSRAMLRGAPRPRLRSPSTFDHGVPGCGESADAAFPKHGPPGGRGVPMIATTAVELGSAARETPVSPSTNAIGLASPTHPSGARGLPADHSRSAFPRRAGREPSLCRTPSKRRACPSKRRARSFGAGRQLFGSVPRVELCVEGTAAGTASGGPRRRAILGVPGGGVEDHPGRASSTATGPRRDDSPPAGRARPRDGPREQKITSPLRRRESATNLHSAP